MGGWGECRAVGGGWSGWGRRPWDVCIAARRLHRSQKKLPPRGAGGRALVKRNCRAVRKYASVLTAVVSLFRFQGPVSGLFKF